MQPIQQTKATLALSQGESLTTLIPQTTPMLMELTQLDNDSESVNMIRLDSKSLSPQTGKNSLMNGSQHTEQPVLLQDCDLTQSLQEKPFELSELQFPKRKRVLNISKDIVAQTQKVLAQHRNKMADMILQGLNNSTKNKQNN